MRFIAVGAVLALSAVGIGPAEAKGCIKGALVGGLAGHAAGHGVIGAMGGCAAGRALANRADRRDTTQPPARVAPSKGATPAPNRGAGGYVSY